MFINFFNVGTFWGSTPVLTWCPLEWTKKNHNESNYIKKKIICFHL